MPLRVRLILSIIAALLAGMTLAAGVTVWQARAAVRREVGSALVIGRQTVETVAAALPGAEHPAEVLQRQILAFDGDRHIRAVLLDPAGAPLATSILAPLPSIVPGWFVRAVGSAPASVRIPLPPESGVGAIRLEGDPRNELAEAWNSLRSTTLVLLAMAAATGLLSWWWIRRALLPLDALARALQEVGAGRFAARLAPTGASEIRVIAGAFNRMAADLDGARERNRLLHEHLLTAQEGERAAIARDLHDEIGPLLFAITVDAAAIEAAAADEARRSAQEIRAVVQQAHERIRAVINRLRPVGLAEFGLERALDNLVEFWRRRHPEIGFSLDVAAVPAAEGELVDVTAFRVVQEAVNNALRHGRPTRIGITLKPEPPGADALLLEIEDDGGGSAAEPGFGLTAMRDRIEAVGGKLVLTSNPGQGFRVAARLPLRLGQAAETAPCP
jgi:two-component system sensor histidine kinase UhpB